MRSLGRDSSMVSWKRRIIYTLVLLAAAGLLAWWGSHKQGKRHRAIHQQLTMLCESLAAGERPAGLDQILADPVAEQVIDRLQTAVAAVPADDPDALRIEVGPVADSPYKSGSATHQATVFVYDTPELVLLVESGPSPERVTITGWREPG